MKAAIHTADGVKQCALIESSVAGCKILVRAGWGPDQAVLDEWRPTYRRMEHLLAPGHSVLDIGANIGMFSVVALARGVDRVVCYEPEDGVFSVLMANLGRDKRATLVPAAIGATKGKATLAVPKSGNATAASTYFPPARGRQLRSVSCEALAHVLREYKPSIVKFDCEGEELNFIDGRTLPKHVRVITGELHREGGNEDRCKAVISTFDDWKQVHAPASYSFNRCWTISYYR